MQNLPNFYKVTFGGITAYCDAYISCGANDCSRLSYLSVFGDTEQTKAIVAAFVGGREIDIHYPGTVNYVISFRRERRELTFKNLKLEQGIHTVVYCPELYDLNTPAANKVVVGSSKQECYGKLYQLLRKHRTTPLLPEWQELIMDEMKVENLSCFGFPHACAGALIKDETLEEYVQSRIRYLAQITNQGGVDEY
jgi:hypothetical protein